MSRKFRRKHPKCQKLTIFYLEPPLAAKTTHANHTVILDLAGTMEEPAGRVLGFTVWRMVSGVLAL